VRGGDWLELKVFRLESTFVEKIVRYDILFWSIFSDLSHKFVDIHMFSLEGELVAPLLILHADYEIEYHENYPDHACYHGCQTCFLTLFRMLVHVSTRYDEECELDETDDNLKLCHSFSPV